MRWSRKRGRRKEKEGGEGGKWKVGQRDKEEKEEEGGEVGGREVVKRYLHTYV